MDKDKGVSSGFHNILGIDENDIQGREAVDKAIEVGEIGTYFSQSERELLFDYEVQNDERLKYIERLFEDSQGVNLKNRLVVFDNNLQGFETEQDDFNSNREKMDKLIQKGDKELETQLDKVRECQANYEKIQSENMKADKLHSLNLLVEITARHNFRSTLERVNELFQERIRERGMAQSTELEQVDQSIKDSQLLQSDFQNSQLEGSQLQNSDPSLENSSLLGFDDKITDGNNKDLEDNIGRDYDLVARLNLMNDPEQAKKASLTEVVDHNFDLIKKGMVSDNVSLENVEKAVNSMGLDFNNIEYNRGENGNMQSNMPSAPGYSIHRKKHNGIDIKYRQMNIEFPKKGPWTLSVQAAGINGAPMKGVHTTIHIDEIGRFTISNNCKGYDIRPLNGKDPTSPMCIFDKKGQCCGSIGVNQQQFNCLMEVRQIDSNLQSKGIECNEKARDDVMAIFVSRQTSELREVQELNTDLSQDKSNNSTQDKDLSFVGKKVLHNKDRDRIVESKKGIDMPNANVSLLSNDGRF
ncbi:MAG: hypothetical protein AAFO15_01830 [Pseudomonadota bacterium]